MRKLLLLRWNRMMNRRRSLAVIAIGPSTWKQTSRGTASRILVKHSFIYFFYFDRSIDVSHTGIAFVRSFICSTPSICASKENECTFIASFFLLMPYPMISWIIFERGGLDTYVFFRSKVQGVRPADDHGGEAHRALRVAPSRHGGGDGRAEGTV